MRYLTLAFIATSTALGACTSAEEQERRQTAAMIEQAKADAAAESTFVQDSVKLTVSITVDTMEFSRDSVAYSVDDEGKSVAEHEYRVYTRDRAICLVDSTRYNTIQKGDTLSCQWEQHK